MSTTRSVMRYMHAWELYERLPMKHRSVLPDAGFGHRLVAGFNKSVPLREYSFRCLPKAKGKHRLLVFCGGCYEFVPFGRYAQHLNKKDRTCMEHENFSEWAWGAGYYADRDQSA